MRRGSRRCSSSQW